MDKKLKKAILAAGAVAGATAVAIKAKKEKENIENEKARTEMQLRDYNGQHAWFIGGGLASMAGAAYLVRDCNYPGDQITIFEGMKILGGSNDGAGDPGQGFVCRGGRMLNEETYENFWELFSSIPSLEKPNMSVTQEILNFDHLHPTHAQARLIDKDGVIQDVSGMGFNNDDRLALGKLMLTPEEDLDDMTIQEWFEETPHFFETNFWYMWQTTFAFQKWSSLFEFKRYMERMIFEFSRIETLEGVTRTPYNQYESVILPLKTWLTEQGVHFVTDAVVTDLDFAQGSQITVNAIHLQKESKEEVVTVNEGDICIMTNGCMTDCATLGDLHTPASYEPENPISGNLWAKVAEKKEGLGNPAPFFGKPEETNWESFTVTMKGNKLLKMIEDYSGNIPGSGALMTFKDSSWLMSIVVAAQPHFRNQPIDTTIFWGYGLYTENVGDYVKKPMRECTGEEMLTELLHHLHMEDQMDEIMESVVNVIPCMMPYIDSQFQPRKMSDRPKVVPEGSTNFAMISQFVEIPEDMVFTEEYSVRAARIAVYTLMNVTHKKICPVTPYKKNPKVLAEALKTSYR
ncbi:oleate hydratase [Diplocloster agilis]|uniref:Oleate hydratase n=1 Tax=Diplocloster agilis TaxID=2850323 RepID=A0A949NCJ6_9FIRM|nr:MULTISPECIES: oleate hydratase [Lachnospiraceae]MBU9738767.1 oleate hydratase [Diplocloster agilis]MBU9746492.1 oleate hydratase [Diplocloster agilis]MCU6736219.1 oleate hydratase [Suonthocola fibrivorans]SCJ87997.1 Oleate hydratase [uncultured Clostridium sp.]